MADRAAETGRQASGSETRQRRHLIPVRMNDAEREELLRRAENAGLSPAAFIRQRALDSVPPRARPRPTLDRQAFALALGQLGKLGSNVNQIAKRLNQDERLGKLDLLFIRNIAEEVQRLRAEIMTAMGRRP